MQELENNFPKQFGTYHEPFLGGGAVMFNLLSKEPKLSCNVSDFNSDLILAYITIRDKLGKLVESLENHSKNYHNDSTEYYYDCLLYTSPSPRDYAASRMPSSA